MWYDRNLIMKEMESIFHSLKEAIITIDLDGINFSNNHGKKILQFIEFKEKLQANQQQSSMKTLHTNKKKHQEQQSRATAAAHM